MAEIDVASLCRAAREVRLRAYAPYSGFQVGAAVVGEDGRVAVGANVENASYPVSLCAERSAVAAAVASGQRNLLAVAVVSMSHPPAPPCGACRQVLAEFGDPVVYLSGIHEDDPVESFWLHELLPHQFSRKALSGDDPRG